MLNFLSLSTGIDLSIMNLKLFKYHKLNIKSEMMHTCVHTVWKNEKFTLTQGHPDWSL